jgi:hypothetical protein
MKTLFEEHSFNTEWLGEPFGIAFGAEPLTMNVQQLRSATRRFRWVEVRCKSTDVPSESLYPTNGLIHVDTQLHYQLPLGGLGQTPKMLRTMALSDMTSSSFRFNFAPFKAERYLRLSIVDQECLNHRYELWASKLMREHPQMCLKIMSGTEVVGYSFAQAISDKKMNLDLVAATTTSNIPGLGLYRAALNSYRQLGFQQVQASFSSSNISALNVHISLGCRILSATHIWLLDKFHSPENSHASWASQEK